MDLGRTGTGKVKLGILRRAETRMAEFQMPKPSALSRGCEALG
jgi:hypothetical protein